MQIKKFVAPTLKEATLLMKKELGDEAIILGTRVIEGDRTLNQKKMYEITAGIDTPATKKSVPSKNAKSAAQTFEKEIESLTQKIFETPKEKKSFYKKEVEPEVIPPKSFLSEKRELKETLLKQEVQRSLANNLIDQLENYDGLTDGSGLEEYLLKVIASMIPTKEFNVKKNRTTKIALVGPTGVGKTTCIAKLAVISKLIHKLKVGLISIDTYRLGAIDQLRIFSEISEIEMAVAYEPTDMPKLINKFKDKNLVFIDTVGRSQRSAENLSKIKEYIGAAKVDDVSLVVSSTTSTRTLLDIAEKFSLLEYSNVIFTKADEAASYGNILNFTAARNVPVMFLTNGQVIPDDILSVNSDYLAKLVLSGKLY